jgi:hypothetical protein
MNEHIVGQPGFVFWGLFLVCAVVVVGYVVWLWWVEHK